MAAGDTTEGRRLEVKADRKTGRDDVNRNMPQLPGDYTGPVRGYTGDRGAVFFRLPVADDHPDAGVRHITEPPHAFTEEADGSLTVSPSILAVRPDGNGWHGYLEHGIWREV